MPDRPNIMNQITATWLIVAAVIGTAAVLIGGRIAARENPASVIGHHWRSLTPSWGEPDCTAQTARLSTRESVSRPTAQGGGLVIPHLELIIEDPAPAIGPSASNGHRTFIWSEDATVDRHMHRVTIGDLRAVGMETRIAVNRSKPVRVVRINSSGNVIEINSVRPVFVTVLPR